MESKTKSNWKVRAALIISLIAGLGAALICLQVNQTSGKVWSYLLPIFPVVILTILFGLWERKLAYLYIVGYSISCLAWIIWGIAIGGGTGNTAIFVGGAGLAMALSIFGLIWIIFWKIWRSISALRGPTTDINPHAKD